jgi:thiol-disulfide isomerase/thioredoxin|tara:strand:- start:998 stop:1597 length:600 start_codon:yes stop_codon:yes gene_type:complete
VKINRCIRIVLVATLTWLVLTTFSGCAPKTITPTDINPSWSDCSQKIGNHVCDFKLVDQNGQDFNLYDHYGKVIILDFSAMWCGPCRMAAMEVDSLVEKFGKENVVYATLLIENSSGNTPSLSDLESWAKESGIEISPVLGASRDFLNVTDYQISAWPTFYFIDKNMVLKDSLVGYSAYLLESQVSSLLAEQDTGLQGP